MSPGDTSREMSWERSMSRVAKEQRRKIRALDDFCQVTALMVPAYPLQLRPAAQMCSRQEKIAKIIGDAKTE
jgi:hypothetical protein